MSCVSVPLTSSSAGCSEGGREQGAGAGKGRGAAGRVERPSLPRTLIRLRRRPLSPYSKNRQHQRGVGVTQWKGYHGCGGFIRMNKSLLYMAEWRCPKETRRRTGTKSECGLII